MRDEDIPPPVTRMKVYKVAEVKAILGDLLFVNKPSNEIWVLPPDGKPSTITTDECDE